MIKLAMVKQLFFPLPSSPATAAAVAGAVAAAADVAAAAAAGQKSLDYICGHIPPLQPPG